MVLAIGVGQLPEDASMDLNTRNVVVVGANTADRRALQLALELEGYAVHSTETAGEARRLVDQHWPEAIILDVSEGRPEMLALARDLRANRLHRHIVLVASSPIRFPEQEAAAYESGCDVYLVRAGQTRELAEVLDTYLLTGGSPASGESEAHILWN